MSHTVTIEEAAGRLADLVAHLNLGDEITLLAHERAVARIIPARREALPPGFGACKGMLVRNPEVPEDAYLEDFKDYL